MNLPPPVLPPTDYALRQEIDAVCESIVRDGEIGEERFRDQEMNKSLSSFAYLGKGCDYFCFHLACLKNHISKDQETEMIRSADPTLSKIESDQVYDLLQNLKGSGKSIASARQYMSPLLPKKGYSLCRLFYQKFCSVSTFGSKLVVLYLINDILATNHKVFPGFSECVKPYVEVMMNEIRNLQPSSNDKLERLISIWSDHRLFSPASIQRFRNALHGTRPNPAMSINQPNPPSQPTPPIPPTQPLPPRQPPQPISPPHQQSPHQRPQPRQPSQSPHQRPSQPPSHLLSRQTSQRGNLPPINDSVSVASKNWPPAGLVSDVYEDHARLGVKPYTPVDGREIRGLQTAPDYFEIDVARLIEDYKEGVLFQSIREQSRIYGEEVIGQGELVFPDERHSRSRRRPRGGSRVRSRSPSTDYSYSSSSRSRSYSSRSSRRSRSYSSSRERSRSRH